jgi:hypothetical protein
VEWLQPFGRSGYEDEACGAVPCDLMECSKRLDEGDCLSSCASCRTGRVSPRPSRFPSSNPDNLTRFGGLFFWRRFGEAGRHSGKPSFDHFKRLLVSEVSLRTEQAESKAKEQQPSSVKRTARFGISKDCRRVHATWTRHGRKPFPGCDAMTPTWLAIILQAERVFPLNEEKLQ